MDYKNQGVLQNLFKIIP